ncbi:MAG: hypothetical protein HY801_09790, partial [Candidatus Lindowbacteria bacterium]|nr:hypothetical protein [Candidatus Lindowbacteria bacterium]
MRDEAESQETFRHLKDELVERERQLAVLATRVAEAQAASEERQRSSEETKEQIDKTEAELAALKEKHKNLLTMYQETLPARDAAQREVMRAKVEMEKLDSEIAVARETVGDAESHAAQARQNRTGIEAELQKVKEKAKI